MTLMTDDELAGLLETIKRREMTYMDSATNARTTRDVVMFTAFASTLRWVLREVKVTIAPHVEPEVTTDAVARERAQADAAHEAEDEKPLTTPKEEQSKQSA
jgi:hypothetical protein